MSEFGKRLKLLREQKELPLSKLAEDLDTTKSALSRYENGKMEPGLTALIKISEYFNVTLDWLAGNGDINQIQYVSKSEYNEVLDECIKENITPDKLSKIIDVMRK